jgi:hypothetical protein
VKKKNKLLQTWAAKPKQIIDKVTTDINAATAAATENLKAAEDEAKSEN